MSKIEEAFEDAYAAYRKECRYMYTEYDEYLKYDPERMTNNRLQESWWNQHDDSAYEARIVQSAIDQYDDKPLEAGELGEDIINDMSMSNQSNQFDV